MEFVHRIITIKRKILKTSKHETKIKKRKQEKKKRKEKFELPVISRNKNDRKNSLCI